jgi:hypothetical protein
MTTDRYMFRKTVTARAARSLNRPVARRNLVLCRSNP